MDILRTIMPLSSVKRGMAVEIPNAQIRGIVTVVNGERCVTSLGLNDTRPVEITRSIGYLQFRIGDRQVIIHNDI